MFDSNNNLPKYRLDIRKALAWTIEDIKANLRRMGFPCEIIEEEHGSIWVRFLNGHSDLCKLTLAAQRGIDWEKENIDQGKKA